MEKERVILHSDLNSFYASVEAMLDPSLKGKAVAVCGATEDRHGIVLAKSDLAKKAGIKTGMVNWEARALCKDLIMVPPHYDQYVGCDVLLCEINPPRLEGLFLAENIKKLHPRVNIIFVTVCSENEHAKAVMRLKPSGYLTKEATNAQIQEELQNLRYPIT